MFLRWGYNNKVFLNKYIDTRHKIALFFLQISLKKTSEGERKGKCIENPHTHPYLVQSLAKRVKFAKDVHL